MGMENVVLYASPGFLAFVIGELWLARRRGRVIAEGRDSAASLAMGVGSLVVGFAWGGIALAASYALYEHRLFEIGASWWVFAAAVLADDFMYYWFHRTHHEIRALWGFHVAHHSSRRYNYATALRQPWSPMSTLLFSAPLAWLGFDPLMLVGAHGVNLIYQFWVHTELVDRCPRWFEAVFNTPSHHRVHHGANPRYLDRNYGGILIVWDRLFGTFEPEGEPVRFGLTKDIDTYNPFRIAFEETFAVLRDAWRARDWRAAFGYLLAPPGWRPEDGGQTARDLRRAAVAAEAQAA